MVASILRWWWTWRERGRFEIRFRGRIDRRVDEIYVRVKGERIIEDDLDFWLEQLDGY